MTAAASQDDADIDACKAVHVEEAYHYGLFHKDNYYITNKNKITGAKYSIRSNFLPGASTYVWN